MEEDLQSIQNQSVNLEGESILNITQSILEDEVNHKVEVYNPNLDEQICCIELINNNKIYIRYEQNWKIKDVSVVFLF